MALATRISSRDWGGDHTRNSATRVALVRLKYLFPFGQKQGTASTATEAGVWPQVLRTAAGVFARKTSRDRVALGTESSSEVQHGRVYASISIRGFDHSGQH